MPESDCDPLPCVVTGDPSQPIMFFIHGWPDTYRIWDSQIEHFASRFRCVAVKLPSYEKRTRDSHTFEQLEDRLVATIQTTLSASPHRNLTLVCHDWGALFGYLLEQRLGKAIDKLVTIDVGANFQMENWRQRVGIMVYQFWLITAYFIGKPLPPVGDLMTQCMATLLRSPKRPVPTHSEMNYLYWYFWRSLLKTGKFAAIDGQYEPTRPILFIFGKQKPFHLHTQAWIEYVNARKQSQAIGVDADHWVMVRKPSLTNRIINEYISSGVPISLDLDSCV